MYFFEIFDTVDLVIRAKPSSPVGIMENSRKGGRCFEYPFCGLMFVMVTGFIPLPPLSIVSTIAT